MGLEGIIVDSGMKVFLTKGLEGKLEISKMLLSKLREVSKQICRCRG
jgi:hypothetical protein